MTLLCREIVVGTRGGRVKWRKIHQFWIKSPICPMAKGGGGLTDPNTYSHPASLSHSIPETLKNLFLSSRERLRWTPHSLEMSVMAEAPVFLRAQA